jgi:two-component system, OmpR family, response regulator
MKLLYVEDNEAIATVTTDSLKRLGFVVEHTHTFDHAEMLMETEEYDVYVLDRMLGDKDGLELCKKRKRLGDNTPTLMLTALTGLNSRIDGYENGADDYMEKPFSVKELALRIQALSRRGSENKSAVFVTIDPTFKVDLSRRELLKNDVSVNLTPKLWSLLEYLALNPSRTFSKLQLIEHVWGIDKDVLDNAVEAAVSKLRSVLNDKDGKIIQTSYGQGYRLVVE